MEQQARGSLRCVMTGIALSASLALTATALGQSQGQNVSQEGTSRAGSRNTEAAAPANDIDAQTGKILNEAIELMNSGNNAGAAQKIGTLNLERLSPYERGTVERILFNISYEQERYDEARGHLQKAIESGGLNAQQIDDARYQSAQLYIQEEKWREGAAALEEWLKTAASPNSAAYYMLTIAYYQQEDFERALAPAKKTVELMDPAKPNENWLNMLSVLYLQREEYRESIPVLLRLIEVAPDKKIYWLQLSTVYGQLEDYPNALAILQLAHHLGLVTEDADVRRLADLLVFNGIPYRGAQVLEAAIEHQAVTLDDKLYEKLANCWIAAGELDKALAPLEEGAGLSASGNLFVRLGEVNVQRGDWPAAERALERGIGKGQLADAGNAQLLMGIALFNQARFAEARAWFQQAMQSERYRSMARAYLDIIEQTIATPSSKPLDREG